MMFDVRQGDVLEVLRGLPDESVHCCVTSPPYWGLRDYGVPGQLGLEPTPEEHIAAMVEVFREVRRVLRADGTCWVNYGDCYAKAGESGLHLKTDTSTLVGSPNVAHRNAQVIPPNLKPKDLVMMPARIALALQADGWWLRSEIIWAKPNPMPESVTDRPTSAHEKVFLLSKAARYFYDADAVREAVTGGAHARGGNNNPKRQMAGSAGTRSNGTFLAAELVSARNLRNVWTIATEPFPEAHFATFPQALVRPCILAGTSEKGCCPECGGPWERVVERTDSRGSWGERTEGVAGQPDGLRGGDFYRNWQQPETTGFRPTCSCPPAEPVPCTVLDPFTGSGTTGVVAMKLGRRFVGAELNPEYHRLATERIRAAALGMPLRELRSGQGHLFEAPAS